MAEVAKKPEGAWDSGSRGEGSTGAKGAGAMGLTLWGQMGVWASGKMPGRKALGWAHRGSAGRKGLAEES